MFRNRKLRVSRTAQRAPIEECHETAVKQILKNDTQLAKLTKERDALQEQIRVTESFATVQKLQENLFRVNNAISRIQDKASLTK